ncbi:MAG: glycosyltransferase family 39 protein [Terracidiphilus sp.]
MTRIPPLADPSTLNRAAVASESSPAAPRTPSAHSLTDEDRPSHTHGRVPFDRATLILVPLLILLYLAQCAWFIRTQSFTNDEPEHLVAGLEAWRFGEFKHWHDQPPLGRLLFTLPLLNTNWSYQLIDDQVHPVTPTPEVWLYRSRPVNVLLGVALLLLLWQTARRLFSAQTALFVLALGVLSPDLIAHFSLATIDGVGCLFIFACAVQSLHYRHNPSRAQAAILGLLLGGMLLAKFNSPPLFALALGMVFFLRTEAIPSRLRGFRWRRTAAVFLLACLVVWTGYFFHVSKVTFADQMVTIHFSGYTKLLQYEMPTLQTPITIFLPACEWMTGLGQVVAHNIEGHRSFLLGHYSPSGFKLYFPLAMLLKWPPIVLLLGAAGATLVLVRRFPARRDLLLLGLFPAVYFAFAVTARIDIGIRHMLPVYPFLLLYAGAFAEWARGWRWNPRWTGLLFAVLLLAQAADIARYAPGYLSYFTPLVKPADTWKLLSDSNTDWGQGLVALRQFQAEHPGEPLHLAYVGEVDPAWYGIRYTRLKEEDHPSGLVVVSATHLSGQLLKNHSAYRWLLQYPLKTVLDHALYVFDVPASGRSN